MGSDDALRGLRGVLPDPREEPRDRPGDARDLQPLIAHLAGAGSLTRAQAARLVGDVMSFLDETVERFVRRRHGELQRAGWANRDIFAALGDELLRRRFRAPGLTERQLRRMVYG